VSSKEPARRDESQARRMNVSRGHRAVAFELSLAPPQAIFFDALSARFFVPSAPAVLQFAPVRVPFATDEGRHGKKAGEEKYSVEHDRANRCNQNLARLPFGENDTSVRPSILRYIEATLRLRI
jgi:hypothetical protein